jgi:Domain of unknown function (DUF4158)
MEIVEAPKSLTIEELPSYEEALALDWTLSLEDARFVLQSVKGEQQILYFAATLNSLKNTGDFLDGQVPLSNKIIHYLSKQLGITPTSSITVSRNSESLYRQKIKNYLGYRDFASNEEHALKVYIQQEMQKELFSSDRLREKAYAFLKAQKILRPAVTLLDRILASHRKEALDYLYEKIANKLTTEQKSKLLSLLKRQPHLLSQVNYYKKSPPEPTATKINTFINRFNELDALGITKINFSDIGEAIFNQLELLGRTYDANAIKQLRSDNKKMALLICTLVFASKNILDHILDMNDKLLSKKERISRNLYNKTLKIINKQAKKGLKFLIQTTRQWWHHENPAI